MKRLKYHTNLLNRIIKSPGPGMPGISLLEQVNFNALLFAATLFSIISCIFNFIEGFDLTLDIFTILSSIVLAFLYYLSRFRKYFNIWLSVFTILLLLSISWFMAGGAIGSTSYIYILALILFIIIAKPNQQNRIFLIFILNALALYMLEYYMGKHLVHPYSNATFYYSDMIFVFILVLFCVFFLTRFIKRSYDYEREMVNNQKIIIEEQNREHISSLTYASYIQKKIISDESKFQFLFDDYFILFKPRDIVSGDFFWIKERGDYGIMAVADCTGHGVPAAFLSIMGISLLEEIMNQESENLNASALLEKLRDKFIAYLEKNNPDAEHSRDGMDMGICVINYRDSIFQFSGANRPLILLRNNQYPAASGYDDKVVTDTYTLYSYKPVKNTIGFNYKEYSFIGRDIPFHPKDTFYLFSDGYTDQFDSKNKKKFTIAQLKTELLRVQDLPLPTQGEYLDNLHRKWKVNTGQTDDILIVGMRM